MRAVTSLLIASLAAVSSGCSDTSGPDLPARELEPGPLLTVAPTSLTIRAGETLRLTAAAKRGAAHLIGQSALSWFSSNENVATVTASGLVRGVHSGEAEIFAVWGRVRGRAHVTVVEDVIDGSGHHGCLKPLLSGDGPRASPPAC